MSSLIKKLNNVRQPEPQPLGFMLSSHSSEKARMQIIASLRPDLLETASEALKFADGLIIDPIAEGEHKAVEKFCKAEDNLPAGRRLKETDEKSGKKVLDTVCDFLIFNSSSPVSAVKKENFGRILELDLNLGDSLLRAAGDLPVDALMTPSNISDNSLTLQNLMVIQRLVSLVNKPVLVFVSNEIGPAELQSLWDIGICGIVLEVTGSKSMDRLAEIRQKIEKLGPPAFRKKSKMTAILPQSQTEKPAPEDNGDDDNEEEDE
jgi:hypothetical protein